MPGLHFVSMGWSLWGARKPRALPTSQRGRPSPGLLALGVAVVAVTLAGCAYPAGNPQALSKVDFPDPAGVTNASTPGYAQIYGTGTQGSGGNGYNIVTEQWQVGTDNVSGLGDALPSPGYPLVAGQEWAPTVRYVGGQYVMWMSAAVSTNPTHCLVEAVSPTAQGPFHSIGKPYCDQDFLTLLLPLSDGKNVGLLDPSLFYDPVLNNWVLYWSRQWAPGGGSEIVDMVMNPDGSMPLLRLPTTVVTYEDAVEALGSHAPTLGSSSYIENPQMLFDSTTFPTSPFTLSVSLGSYGEPGSDHTISFQAGSLQGAVDDAYLTEQSIGGAANPLGLDNPAGLSTLTDNEVDNYLFFAAPYAANSPTPRYLFWEAVGVCSSNCPGGGQGLPGVIGKLLHSILPAGLAPYLAPYIVPASVPYTAPVPR